MLQRARELVEVAAGRLVSLTGVRASPYVAQLIGEDIAALARYALNPRERHAEREQAAAPNSLEDAFAFARAHFGVGPVQDLREIGALLDLAREHGADLVCEIGSRDAGTSVLFSRVLRPRTLIVMDLYVKNRWRLRRAAPEGQSVCVIDGDSTHPLTVARLRRRLRGRQLDLLLIDGDHRWRGVRQDFINYREFVREGGLVAFHDISEVTDPAARGHVGDVPAFWKMISALYPSQEFIATPGQQGLGIGVIHYRREVSIAPVLAAPDPPG